MFPAPGPPDLEVTPAGRTDGAAARRPGDELLETVFEQAPLGMVVLDSGLRVVRANSAFAEILGTTTPALMARSFGDITHPEDRERSTNTIARLQRREVTWVTVQQRCLRDDGQTRWGEFAIRIFWGADGEFLHALAIVRDITETVRAEAALRDSEIRNWRITESNMLGLFEWSDAVTITEANDAFLQIVGYTREELRAGRIRWSEILPPGSEDVARRLREELLTTGRVRPLRLEYQARSGARIPVLSGAARISWEPVRGIGFLLDMSEQRKVEDERAKVESALRESLAELEQAQARLQLADRMAAMGTLAAGVAHEINNPLGFVVANLGFAQEEVAALRDATADGEQLETRLAGLSWALGEAQEGATRVRDIVLDLRTFSHPDASTRVPVDIQRLIDSAVNLAQGEIRGRATVVRRYQPVPPVLGTQAHLSQLFLNLIVNAAHAIPPYDAGGLACGQGLDPGSSSTHEIRLTVEPASDGRVMIEIADTGAGIAPEHLEKIFDPFIPVKSSRQGTGLGLSICHGIVRSLGGQISVSSTLGAGTAFRVLLPAANAPPPPLARPSSHAAGTVEEPVRARVLVVDDEPLMGSAIGRVLSEHEVVALTSARTAMSRISSGERFDVILCDVMMPDFSGIELYEGIAREAPELLSRLVFVTGGAYTPEAIQFLERIRNLRLEKPILPQALHGAVTSILSASTKAQL